MTPLPTVAAIKRAVAAEYGVSVADLDGRSRLRIHARPRHVAMVLAYRLTDHPKARISFFFRRSPNLVGEVIGQSHPDQTTLNAMRRVTLQLVRR